MGQGKLLEFDHPQTLIADEKSSFHKLWAEHDQGTNKTF